MLRAVIFDLDGVIVDSEPLHCEADLLTMRDYGREMQAADFNAYVGVSGPDMWADLREKLGIPDALEGIIARQAAHKRRLLERARLAAIPGIPELMDAAAGAGLRLAVASSSPRHFIEAVLGKLGILGRFSAVASGEEAERGKPAPDVFLKAAELLGARPGECLVIEDSGAGVRAAKAAGMACVGFRNPHSGNQDLREADEIVNGIGEIELGKYIQIQR